MNERGFPLLEFLTRMMRAQSGGFPPQNAPNQRGTGRVKPDLSLLQFPQPALPLCRLTELKDRQRIKA